MNIKINRKNIGGYFYMISCGGNIKPMVMIIKM